MWVRPFIVVVTVLFVNLGWAVFQHDGYTAFIPLAGSFQAGRVLAYDFFLVIAVLLLRLVAARLGVTLSTIRTAVLLFFGRYDFIELVVIGVAAVGTQLFGVPLLLDVLADPIAAINGSHDGIKRVIVIVLPVLWAITVSVLLRGGGRRVVRAAPTQAVQSSVMPPTPF